MDYKYYLLPLLQHFPKWKQCNVIFTSDDIQYCKTLFAFLENAFFIEDLSAIEQLVLGARCDDFIISNSTFSWWLAWLGEKENTKIIRPIKNFRGKFASQNDDTYYFLDRWIAFDKSNYNLELKFWRLIVVGETIKMSNLINYNFNMLKIRSKKRIKKILGR